MNRLDPLKTAPSKIAPKWKRQQSWRTSSSSSPDTFTSDFTTTAPDDRSVYMAASRRSPLIDDQWQGEDDHRARQRHREREYRRRRPESPSPTRRAPPDDPEVHSRSLGNDDPDRSSRYHHRSREHHSHHSERSHRREPREGGREEEATRSREPELEVERHSRRTRHRERSPTESKRHRDHEPDHRRRSHHHAERRSSHREYTSRHERRESRERTSTRAREGYPYHSREESYRRRGSYDHDTEDYDHGARAVRRRHRDRSPPPEDEYSSHEPYTRHPSPPGRSHHYRHEHSKYHHERRRPSSPQDREDSPVEAREDWDREASPREARPPRRSGRHRESTRYRSREYAADYDSGREVARSRSPGARPSEGRMQSTQPIQSILDDQPRRRSPPRPIPSFDDARGSADEQIREHFPMHGMKASDVHGNQRMPPHIDTRHQYTGPPSYGATPTSSHHGSPHSGSPYSAGRGGWGGPPNYMASGPHVNAYSPQHRQNSYPPPNGHHGQYYGGSPQYPYPQASPGYQSPSYRGSHHGHGPMRGGYPPQDRRYSGGSTGPPTMGGSITPTRGRGGHFQNLHWNANGSHRGGRAADNQPRNQSVGSGPGTATERKSEIDDEDENPFRPSKDFRVEDQGSKEGDTKESSQGEHMPPPDRSRTEEGAQSKEASKFSFAFKAKPTTAPTAKPPVPDLTQKMKEPPPASSRRDLFHDRKPAGRMQPRDEPPPRNRQERRPDGWDDRRGDWRGREYDHRWRDEGRERNEFREHRRYDRRYEREPPRHPEKTTELRLVKKTLKRPRDKPQLDPEFKSSNSVYFRKDGNESVIGSGTYGKVYKGIHVFTKGLVALKKIRMEGERDGFPITAVRELKLLQSLRHKNIVALHEVMVERNDCFMVFEYLSHDLTGLLNHPTFQLEQAHKKDLAKQLFQALDYLHKRGVLHRDIKAANILVSNVGLLKLADFGLARFYDKHQNLDYTNRVITIWYRSPELLLGETRYGPAVDVWSAACVMVEIFTRHAIFPGDGGEISQLEKLYNVLGTPTTKEWPGLVDMAWFELLRPTEKKPSTFAEKYKDRLTEQAFELLESMFLYDPSKRPGAGDVLEHPYFTTEDPAPKQAIELKDLQGDWHEFESKALRRENERKDKEARRIQKQEEYEREKAKRRAPSTTEGAERDPKRPRPSGEEEPDVEMK